MNGAGQGFCGANGVVSSWRALALGAMAAWLSIACTQPSAGSQPGLHGQNAQAEPVIAMGPSIAMTDPRIGVMGRVFANEGELEFGYPGVTVRVCFTGSALALVGSSNNGRSRIAVVVNGVRVSDVTLPQSATEIAVWRRNGAEEQASTCVELVHQTETWIGIVKLSAVRVAGELVQSEPFPERKLLFIGDSVTCGEAVARKPTCSKDPTFWDALDSYGVLAAKQLGAQVELVCYGGRGVVRDWQGRADTLNGPQFFPLVIPDERHLQANLAAYQPHAIVVSLGTNDFNLSLGAFPARLPFVRTYAEFLRTLLSVYPGAAILLTEGAIVADDADSRAKSVLREYLQAVVSEVNATSVAYMPSTHYPGDTCDSHPTDRQHAAMAAEVATTIASKLGW